MVTEEKTIDEKAAILADLKGALLDAGKSGDMATILDLSSQINKLQKDVQKGTAEANKGKIAAAEATMFSQFSAIVDNSGLKDLLGEDITNIIWYRTKGEDNQPVTGVRINAKRKPPAKGGTRSGTKASVIMTRKVNGKPEDLSVKAIVETYADDKVRALSLFEKKAWSSLFTRVNDALDTKFEERATEADDN